MLVDVSPMFLIAALSVLAGITYTAKTFFDARMAALDSRNDSESLGDVLEG
ncbi:hypothetical protein QQM79_09345 [Marinobacteraceae bacterium S3BR75-40.1]